MTKIDEARLKEIEARCEAATPGPWEWINGSTDEPREPLEYGSSLRTVEHRVAGRRTTGRRPASLPAFILDVEEIGEGWDDEMEGNTAFIAEAPTLVRDLIAAVRERDAEIEQLHVYRLCLDDWQARFCALSDAWRNGDNGAVLDAVRLFVSGADGDAAAAKDAELAKLREQLRLADEMADAEDELHNYGQCVPACPPGDCSACDADEGLHVTANAYRKSRGAK